MRITGKSLAGLTIGAVVFTLALTAALAAYKTHNESDSELFFKTWPRVAGSRLDGCDACHVRTMAPPVGQPGGAKVLRNSCDSCHLLTDYGKKQADILTPYGRDYMKHGRNAAAFTAIAQLDSDGDGVTNAAEMAALTNPGDARSVPDKKPAAQVIVSYDELMKKRIPVLEQAMFINVTKSKDGDNYSDMRGFRLIDVLTAAGISPQAESVDVISLDGYTTTFSLDQLRRSWPQSAPVFGLDKKTLGECGWVRYDAKNLKAGQPMPPADILLSFAENGQPYPAATLTAGQRLKGSGPFRVVAPQMSDPGVPDIAVTASKECSDKIPEKYRYNHDYEKNADYCVKAVVAIRVNPMPADRVDINWPEYAKKVIDGKSVIIFGALK